MEYLGAVTLIAGAIVGKLTVDVIGGYLLARKLLKEGYTAMDSEEQIRFRAPSDIEFMSRPGRTFAYWLHAK